MLELINSFEQYKSIKPYVVTGKKPKKEHIQLPEDRKKLVFIGFITLVVVLSQMYMRIQVLEEKVKTLFDLHNKSK